MGKQEALNRIREFFTENKEEFEESGISMMIFVQSDSENLSIMNGTMRDIAALLIWNICECEDVDNIVFDTVHNLEKNMELFKNLKKNINKH